MKTQKNALVVFLLIISVIFTYLTPLVFAEGDPGDPSNSGLGDPSDNQQQGSGNNTGQMGGPGGNQTGSTNENNSGQKGGPGGNQGHVGIRQSLPLSDRSREERARPGARNPRQGKAHGGKNPPARADGRLFRVWHLIVDQT